MAIIKVLKRKDGAALVTGIAVGLIVYAFITGISQDLTQRIVAVFNGTDYSGQGWETAYLLPLVSLILALVALELLIWIYVAFHDSIKQK